MDASSCRPPFSPLRSVVLPVVLASVLWLLVGSLVGVSFAQQCPTDLNAKDAQIALNRAMNQGDTACALALIKSGIDVNAKCTTFRAPLLWAAQWGLVEIVEALVKAGADVNVKDQYGWTPMTLAFEFAHFDVVQALIKAGADRSQLPGDLNAKDHSGFTPLQHALRRKDMSSVRAVIQLGASPNVTDQAGRSGLFWVALDGQLDVVRTMIEAGADVNSKDASGMTALMAAAQMKHNEVLEALVKAGADANTMDPAGWTALMYASHYADMASARVLIPVTNVNLKAKNGTTALTLARWACHSDIVAELTKAGAVTGPREWTRPPRFEDFPAGRIYKGTPAQVDLSSSFARGYRTRLRAGVRQGPNFAGHYTVVSWGCGSNCESIAIVDALTGRVYDGIGDARGASFKINSSLMIADPAPHEGIGYEDDPVDKFPIRYYVWEDHEFKRIYEEACTVTDDRRTCGCELDGSQAER